LNNISKEIIRMKKKYLAAVLFCLVFAVSASAAGGIDGVWVNDAETLSINGGTMTAYPRDGGDSVSGTIVYDAGTSALTITIDGKSYSGFCEMRGDTMTFLGFVPESLNDSYRRETINKEGPSNGYVRLAIKGTNVNLRQQPRASGKAITRVSAGDVFIAEEIPITCVEDGSDWYRIVLSAGRGAGDITPLFLRGPRFAANVAFVSAKYALPSPASPEEMEAILKTPVGAGYAFDADPFGRNFNALTEIGFPFLPSFAGIKSDVDLWSVDVDKKGWNPHEVLGRYKKGESVRVIGVKPDEPYYLVMDPLFKQPAGYVEARAVSLQRSDPREWGATFDWMGWGNSCALSIGANLPEIMRKWGGGEIEITRNAFEFMGEYVIWNSVSFPNFSVTFYEWPPGGEPPSSLAMNHIQTFAVESKGAVGGVSLGKSDRADVKKLLGSPDVIEKAEKEAGGEFWKWESEFNGLMIRFDRAGKASLMTYEARAAD
jgi:hypothetical protein